jgi:hypothetical protein
MGDLMAFDENFTGIPCRHINFSFMKENWKIFRSGRSIIVQYDGSIISIFYYPVMIEACTKLFVKKIIREIIHPEFSIFFEFYKGTR